MKVKIRFGADIEVDGDDYKKVAGVRHSLELQWASISETMEAIIIERVQPLHPDCKFTVGSQKDFEE